MTKEEKQLLFKDLCARLPYSVVVHCTDSDTDYNCFLTTDILHEIQNGYEYYDYKPYLRPLSSMAEEEKKEWYYLYLPLPHKNEATETERRIDWLNEHHFDYRGLIEKSLAIVAPEGMYSV